MDPKIKLEFYNAEGKDAFEVRQQQRVAEKHLRNVYGKYAAEHVAAIANVEREPKLSFTTVLDGKDFSAASHQELISESLRKYKRDSSDINYFVGDNCSTNKALAIAISVSFIGCPSHQYLESFSLRIGKISELMKLLRDLKRRGNLRLKTALQPILRNETR